MKIEAIREPSMAGSTISVRKTAFCDVHTPAHSEAGSTGMFADSDDTVAKAEAKEKSRQKMRKARKILAEKRNALPIVSLPTIPQHR